MLYFWISKGKLEVLRTKFNPAALHGAEASLISQSALTIRRSAFVVAV